MVRFLQSFKFLLPASVFVAGVALWEVVVRVFEVPTIILPRPLEIIAAFGSNYQYLGGHTLTTLYEILGGFALGSLFGMLSALIMTQFPLVRSVIYPIVIASQTTPKIALAPLIVVWFGVGVLPKIGIVALLAFFPVLINTIAGLESTDEGHENLMRTVHASEFQIYWHIRLPSAVPFILAGLKLSITVSVIGAIVAEWVASSSGLGYLLLFYTQYLDVVRTFMVLIVLVAVGMSCFALTALAERLLSWEAKARRGAKVTVAESNL